MVYVDFSEFKSYSSCPVWWKNFVDTTLAGVNILADNIIRNEKLDSAIATYNGYIVSELNEEDIDYLEFETEDDLNAFKIIWTIHGK